MGKTAPSFLVVCLNPTLQRTLLFGDFRVNEVNRTGEYYLDASGKGVNVTRVLTQLGRRAVHLTHAGGRERDLFLSLAAREGLSLTAPDSRSEVRTCYTLLSAAGRTTTELVEEPAPAAPGTEDAVRSAFERLLPEAGCLIISGTRTGGYSKTLFADFTREARRAGKGIILDLRGEDLSACLRERPDFVKPNFAEFAETFLGAKRASEQTEEEGLLARACEKMKEIHSAWGAVCVLTRGKRPMLHYDGTGVRETAPEPIVPVNTTGCGDAFAAGFASGWGEKGFPRYGDPAFAAALAEAVAEGTRAAARNAVNPRPGFID